MSVIYTTVIFLSFHYIESLFSNVNAMTTPIMIYGAEKVLLITRQAILSKAGFTATATSNITDVIDFIRQTEDPALLIVCSSVEEERKRTLLAEVDKVGKNNLRKLILTKNLADESQVNAEVMQTPASPQTFISTVQQAIQ